MSDFKLCYVKLPWVYFTTQDLDKQWGDDWGDIPYEHNAGEPYTPAIRHFCDGREEKVEDDWNGDGTPKWEIKKVAVFGDITEPADSFSNSPYSILDINKGACAWLKIDWLKINPYRSSLYVQAGTSFEDFIKICSESGIEIYSVLPQEATE